MSLDVTERLVLCSEPREQRCEDRVLQDVGVIAGVITVQVAQHDGAILPARREDDHRAMSAHDIRSAERPAPDTLLTEIADYVLGDGAASAEARRIARYCLLDTLGCGILA